ncbi:MAG: site-2 protease family protein [Ruminiclostridium sp.]|nr:site-2 protease family protein [Ruminiclostridium sp.]
MLFDLMKAGGAADIAVIVFSYLVILLIAFPIHECSHAFVAKMLGDNTAEEEGRITLNPFSHLDPMGTIGIMIFGIGWAKSVPINPRRARKVSQKTAMALTAAAGPISNVLVSLIFMIAEKIVIVASGLNDPTAFYVASALDMVLSINLSLAVFNLLPIPPFDGSRIFLAFLPTKYYFSIMRYERFIMIGILVLLYTGILSIPFGILTNLLYSGLDFITGFIC